MVSATRGADVTQATKSRAYIWKEVCPAGPFYVGKSRALYAHPCCLHQVLLVMSHCPTKDIHMGADSCQEQATAQPSELLARETSPV